MDSDKILFLDSGKVSEYDDPQTLLKNPNGDFSRMVEKTGKTQEKNLSAIASDAAMKRIADPMSSGAPAREVKNQKYEMGAKCGVVLIMCVTTCCCSFVIQSTDITHYFVFFVSLFHFSLDFLG